MGIGYSEILLVIVVALVVLGPDKLPEAGRMLGKTLRAFRHVQDDFSSRVRASMNSPAQAPDASQKVVASDPVGNLAADDLPTERLVQHVV